MPAGRPPKYKNPEKLEEKIQEYIKNCEEENNPLTISGLCLFCGFESRQSFYDLEKKPEFSYIIKKARLTIESIYEAQLHKTACSGAIFALKNFGWSDHQSIQIDNTGLPFSIKVESRKNNNTK